MSCRNGAVFLLVISLNLPAWPADKLELSIDTLARGPELVGYPPAEVRWSGDDQHLYFRWKRAGDPRDKDPDTYVVNRDGSGLRKLTEQEARQAPPAAAEFTRDRKLGVYVRDGDIFVYDYARDAARRITRTGDAESNARFLPDGRRIAFTRSNNLYVMALDTGLLEQMTDIRSAAVPSTPAAPATGGGFGFGRGRIGGGAQSTASEQQKGTASQEALKQEERDLLEVIRERAKKREEDEARRKRENPRKPFQLQARQTLGILQLAPGEKTVVATVTESGEGSKTTVVPSYVTESAFTETVPSRTKVGDAQGRTRLALVSAETGEVKWADPGIKDREVTLGPAIFSDDGSKGVVQGRAQDNKDRWIFALDIQAGTLRPIVTLHDDAWVDGPGSFTVGWMKNDEEIYFQSERDGWSHLYTVSYNGGEPRQITSGKWEVLNTQLSRDKTKFYLTTSEGDPGQHQVYVVPASGGERTRLTSAVGHHLSVFSHDEKFFADVYSYTTKPPELYVQETRPGAPAARLTTSPAPEYSAYPWPDPVFVSVPARDGVMVPGRLYKPQGFRKGGPAVIFVHGAGYAQNVHRGWSSQYYRESMFNQFLMKNGFVALDIDYRGSAGYGRDWRTAIYRHMGGKDLDDQVDAARWLVKEHGVDPKRIGIYGGSYGGFITLMALFTQPDVFAAGAALRPVTDWAHYNHGYTSNILNVPQKDAEAYKRSSPIWFASGLKGALLICHGVVDTNVHFQDTVRLVERLIELKKENWELAIYPVEDHAFVQPASWRDEYSRIWALFEKNLKK